MKFELHTIESAPEAVKPELQAVQAAFGTIPNLYRVFATNPATLKIYLACSENLNDHGCLSPVEQQVVYLTVSADNGCSYCVAAHSLLATMVKVPQQVVKELRQEVPLSDPKLHALQTFTRSVMEHRGWVPEADLASFQQAGYDQRHALEVVTILAQKILSNYTNHLAHTPLDPMFEGQAWKKPG